MTRTLSIVGALLFILMAGTGKAHALGTADLSIEIEAPATASQGAEIEYLITVRNDGPDEANGARVIFTVPSGTRYVGSELNGTLTRVAKPSPGGTGMVIYRGDLSPGEETTLSITVKVNNNVADGTDIEATAGIADVTAAGSNVPPTDDPDGSDNSATTITTVV